jgi:hypothetical protein
MCCLNDYSIQMCFMTSTEVCPLNVYTELIFTEYSFICVTGYSLGCNCNVCSVVTRIVILNAQKYCTQFGIR